MSDNVSFSNPNFEKLSEERKVIIEKVLKRAAEEYGEVSKKSVTNKIKIIFCEKIGYRGAFWMQMSEKKIIPREKDSQNR